MAGDTEMSLLVNLLSVIRLTPSGIILLHLSSLCGGFACLFLETSQEVQSYPQT